METEIRLRGLGGWQGASLVARALRPALETLAAIL